MAVDEKKSGKRILYIAIGTVAVGLGAVLFLGEDSADAPVTKTEIDAAPKVEFVAGSKEQADSAAYAQALQRHNEVRVEAAEKDGGSAVPTMIATGAREAPTVNPFADIQSAPASSSFKIEDPSRMPYGNGNAEHAADDPARQQRKQAIQSQMAALMAGWQPVSSAPVTLVDKTRTQGSVSSEGSRTGQAAQAQSSPSARVLAAAGDIFYGTTVNAVVSSSPSAPVLANVIGGPFDGGRMIGNFEKGYDGIVVKLTRLSHRGKTYNINAVAIDAATSQTSISSSVDYRWFERYGMKLATTFLSGYATAASQPSTTITTSPFGGTTSQNSSLNNRQIIMSAAGKTGEALASEIDNSVSQTEVPIITLDANKEIGIMLIDPITEQSGAN